MKRWILGAPLAVALGAGGCDRDRPRDPVETASPQPARSPAASIIRPEVAEQAVVEQPLEPFEETISFAEGGDELDERAKSALEKLLETLQLAEGWPVVLRGHTDSVGDDQANLRVSRRRAETVADWLVEHGLDEQRIEVIALGEQRPVAPNARLDGSPDEPGRAKNRRVTVTIAPRVADQADEPANPQLAPDG